MKGNHVNWNISFLAEKKRKIRKKSSDKKRTVELFSRVVVVVCGKLQNNWNIFFSTSASSFSWNCIPSKFYERSTMTVQNNNSFSIRRGTTTKKKCRRKCPECSSMSKCDMNSSSNCHMYPASKQYFFHCIFVVVFVCHSFKAYKMYIKLAE